MSTDFDNLGSFTIMDNISTNAILARDVNGPIMNYKYVTTASDASTLFWSSGNSTPNIKWGLIDLENFNNPNYLNNDILCKIGQPNTFYSFGSFCVLITCLNGGTNIFPIMSGVKPVSPINNSKNWLLSNNVIYTNTNMNIIPNKNIMIYLEDTNTYYPLRFSIWQAGGGGRIAYTRYNTLPISNGQDLINFLTLTDNNLANIESNITFTSKLSSDNVFKSITTNTQNIKITYNI